MDACNVMREEAALSFQQLRSAVKDIPEGLAWATISPAEDQYLHTNGAIIGIVQHVASGKFIYGSAAFRNLDVRFRDILDRLRAIDTSWPKTLDYLDEAHEYWMASWASLTSAELAKERIRFTGKMLPTWEIIATVTQHDAHHLGQIAMLASVLSPVSEPPDMLYDQEERATKDLYAW